MEVKRLLKELNDIKGMKVREEFLDNLFDKYGWICMGVGKFKVEQVMTYIEGPMDRQIDVVFEDDEGYMLIKEIRKVYFDDDKKVVSNNVNIMETCVRMLLSCEQPIENEKIWHRVKNNHIISVRGTRNNKVTSKDELNHIYKINYSIDYNIFKIIGKYNEEERAHIIDTYYNDLPDTRQIRFVISKEKLYENQVYFKENMDVKIYMSLLDMITNKDDLTDMFVYSVDDAGSMFRVNEELEGIKTKINEAIGLL